MKRKIKIENQIGTKMTEQTYQDMIVPNRTLRFYRDSGIREYTKHIVSVIEDKDEDETLVILKEWFFYKRRWNYTVEHMWMFEIEMRYGSLLIGDRCS